MFSKLVKKLMVSAACLCALVLCGCQGSMFAPTAEQQELTKTPLEQAQDYVKNVDSYAAEISTKSDELIEAVGNSDVVAAKLKLNDITSALDECANMEVPSTLTDEGKKYADACTSMKNVLLSMQDVALAKIGGEDVSQKMVEAQQNYDAAATNLEEADKALSDKLTELNNKK